MNAFNSPAKMEGLASIWFRNISVCVPHILMERIVRNELMNVNSMEPHNWGARIMPLAPIMEISPDLRAIVPRDSMVDDVKPNPRHVIIHWISAGSTGIACPDPRPIPTNASANSGINLMRIRIIPPASTSMNARNHPVTPERDVSTFQEASNVRPVPRDSRAMEFIVRMLMNAKTGWPTNAPKIPRFNASTLSAHITVAPVPGGTKGTGRFARRFRKHVRMIPAIPWPPAPWNPVSRVPVKMDMRVVAWDPVDARRF